MGTPTPPILNTSQQQKRQLSSPETQPSTTDNTFKIQKRQKKSKKKVNADSSIDHLNTSDDNIPEVAKVYEGITGKRPYTKKNINHKLSSVTLHTIHYTLHTTTTATYTTTTTTTIATPMYSAL